MLQKPCLLNNKKKETSFYIQKKKKIVKTIELVKELSCLPTFDGI